MKKTTGILILLFSLFACKSLQKSNLNKTAKIDKNQLIQLLNEKRFAAKTFESRCKIVYNDSVQNFSGNGKIKILKDSIIWGSINFMGIPMVKFYITPHRIQYYNKINKEYYDGDFEFIRNEFGIDLTFSNLQNIFTGDIIDTNHLDNFLFKRKKYYYLLYKKSPVRLDSIKIGANHKVLSEKLLYQNHFAGLSYTGYQKIHDEILPEKISFHTNTGIQLIITYKHPLVNNELRFPFSIPENFTPVIP